MVMKIVTDEQKKQIREMKAQGINPGKVARILGLNYRTTYDHYWHDRTGEETKRGGYKRVVTEELRKQMFQMKDEGKKVQEIAEALGLNKSTVSNYFYPSERKSIRKPKRRGGKNRACLKT